MPPSAALLLLLFGTAIFFCPCIPQSPVAHRMGLTFAWSGTTISILLLALSSLGIHSVAEHPGWQIIDKAGGFPIGHASPVTAAWFTLTGISFLTLLSSFSGRRRLSATAFGLASLVTTTSVALLLPYLLGKPLLYNAGIIPPSLPTALGFLLLGTSLMIPSGQQIWPRNSPSNTASRRATYAFIVTFAVLATGIIMTGILYINGYERQYRAQIESQLSAIATMKMEELAHWRQNYLKDAAVLFGNTSLRVLTQRYFKNPGDVDAKRQLQEWIGLYPDQYSFDQVLLIDTEGVARMSVPAELPSTTSSIREDVSKVLHSGQIELKDFYDLLQLIAARDRSPSELADNKTHRYSVVKGFL